jgi:hypothetical protein
MGLCILASGFMETANSWQAVRYFPISQMVLILRSLPAEGQSYPIHEEEVLIGQVKKRTLFCHESHYQVYANGYFTNRAEIIQAIDWVRGTVGTCCGLAKVRIMFDFRLMLRDL